VAAILADLRVRGDAALLEYTRRFDRLDLSDAARASNRLPQDVAGSGGCARPRSARSTRSGGRSYPALSRYSHQVARTWVIEEPDGTRLGQKVTPLDRVGPHVPGGKAPHVRPQVPMNAIPAKVAGVPNW
jgi:histidinol dehydrogenase